MSTPSTVGDCQLRRRRTTLLASGSTGTHGGSPSVPSSRCINALCRCSNS
ncbi:hypothetical protein CVN56_21470 [Rhodococcus sp. AQ5-07]|nr:hypothetical protein CVN56_21470 [Rhodococcus sp. AQ5-07]